MHRLLLILLLGLGGGGCTAMEAHAETESQLADDSFYPGWAEQARYNQPIQVRDTDSALGRYALKPKTISLKDMARIHGHLCDGLVIASVEIKAVFEKLFPDGIVDRTNLRAVSKNGPCWVDAVAFMTGARINFQTLPIDNSVGDGFIIQKISTGETYQVALKPGAFPAQQAKLEAHIRGFRTEGNPVSASEIDTFEQLSDQLSQKMLSTPPADLVDIRPLPNYRFVFLDMFGGRGDVVNKDMPR